MKAKHGFVGALILAIVGGGLGVAIFNKFTDMGTLYRFDVGAPCGVATYKTGYGEACGIDPDSYVPIKDLGYKSGNKNNHCRGQGFAGHDSGTPNGRCFKWTTCRHKKFGPELFKRCRHKEFGEESFWTKLTLAIVSLWIDVFRR